MFNKILVCLDGSELAEQILPFAEAQALCFGSKLVLLQAFDISGTISASAVRYASQTPGTLEQAIAEEAKKSQTYLERIAQPFLEKGIEVSRITLRGSAGDVIVGYAQNEPVDLIALATHGRSGLGRMLFGSVADFVLRETGLPVLVIKPRQADQLMLTSAAIPKGSEEMLKILVCLDGSQLAEQTLPFAEAQAKCFGGTITLLQVVKIPDNVTMPVRGGASGWFVTEQGQKAEQEARGYLEEVANKLAAKGLNVEVVAEQGSAIDQVILDYALQNKMNIITISSHGRSGLSRTIFGSVTDSVLRQSGLPVLVIKSV
jgi:nucleotide-binding universal stress UspA family protein